MEMPCGALGWHLYVRYSKDNAILCRCYSPFKRKNTKTNKQPPTKISYYWALVEAERLSMDHRVPVRSKDSWHACGLTHRARQLAVPVGGIYETGLEQNLKPWCRVSKCVPSLVPHHLSPCFTVSCLSVHSYRFIASSLWLIGCERKKLLSWFSGGSVWLCLLYSKLDKFCVLSTMASRVVLKEVVKENSQSGRAWRNASLILSVMRECQR